MKTMERDIHLTPQDLLASLQFKPGDFGSIALVSGQAHRAKMCLEKLKDPVKNFTFLGYTFWTGLYKGKKVTVGNGGFYAPDSVFVTEDPNRLVPVDIMRDLEREGGIVTRAS